ncbi:MAG: hypothetical protein COV44_11345 [Deltaproteobacteria bacterium CG11_big_fil_rev_8_21_14_0_20_45_16]|nr:MAG: hypothetical protein COV44_11345 [Deltaproteobacteria bacterium CG11_big_fil_rev_8_21_14_0_20_45_16]
MQEAVLELEVLIKFGRQSEVMDEVYVVSIEDAESVITDEKHGMAFELLRYEWAQVLDPKNKVARYYSWQKGKFVRDRGWELALNPTSAKTKFKDYEITAKGADDQHLLKIKVSGEKLADAMKQARSISKAFLEFRSSGTVQDLEYAGVAEEDSQEGLKDLSLDPSPRMKDTTHEVLRQARMFFEKSRYVQALELFEVALPSAEESMSDLLMASKAALESKRYPVAERYANKILARQARNTEALVIKGMIYNAWQSFDAAVSYWEKALDLQPDDNYIQKCYQECRAKFMKDNKRSIAHENMSEELRDDHEKRSWMRRSCDLPILIKTDPSSEGIRHRILSLSAGGALLKKESSTPFPDRFLFFISFPNFQGVMGVGEKAYETSSQQVGIKFQLLSPKDREFINDQVIKIQA